MTVEERKTLITLLLKYGEVLENRAEKAMSERWFDDLREIWIFEDDLNELLHSFGWEEVRRVKHPELYEEK